jgi:uncharacterized damage-inducible protein DinB
MMNGTISLAVLNQLFDYHYWARDRQFQACQAIAEEQFLRPLGGSFPSLRDTLVHLVAVEWLWLERWRGRSPRTLLQPAEFPTMAAIFHRWRAVEIEMRDYLATVDDETLARPITCVGTRGNSWTFPLWRMMVHFLNHQSYHRGQVTMLLRQLGAQPVPVDFLDAPEAIYSREVGNVREM